MVRLLKEIIKALMPHGLFLLLRHIYYDKDGYSKKIFKKYYQQNNSQNLNSSSASTKKIIYFADGREHTGGLADRLRGIASLYMIAREIGVEFKINFTSPDELTNYLIPNKYDWTIKPNDIVYDFRESYIGNFGHQTFINDVIPEVQRLLTQYNQLHIATNMFIADKEYGALFDLLFKPAPELQKLIEYNLSQIGGGFISASFRFLELLGDFKDCINLVLPEKERTALIQRCLEHLQEIYNENNGEKILVTSDSITFLQEAKKFEFVYVIPGEIAHINYAADAQKAAHMKTFLDYFLLTYSQKLYLVVDGQMYTSGFAYRASLHNSRFIIKRYK